MITVLCHGAFDVLHTGHLEHLRAARAMGDRLIVSVSTDEVVASRKPGRPIQPIGERVAAVRGCRYVDDAWVCQSDDGSAAILHFCPSLFVKGIDYDASTLSGRELEACRKVGAGIAFTQTLKKSSTDLIARIGQWNEAHAPNL